MKRPPLAGVRVIEPGQLLAVPFAARLLVDLGAEVIKIESPLRLDTHRQAIYPDNDPGDAYWDRGGTFYSENRGKLGMTLDLRTTGAVQIFRDLVRVSDVVMENYTPRVMRQFGLDYESLLSIRPDLVYLSSTGYGHTGPWANYGAIGPTTEAASGLAAVTGYPGGPPVLADIPYTDYVAAEQAALAILLALFHRKRTGHGARIDLSQVEAQVALAGELVLDAVAGGSRGGTRGNRHPAMAPHNFFPCAGNDGWIAIAVSSEREWQSLRRAMGEPAWAAEDRFQTLAGRKKHEDELEAALSRWTRNFDHLTLMHRLQEAGVPAGAALDGRELVLNDHLRARGFWEWLDHPAHTGIPPKPYTGVPWRFSDSRRGEAGRGPALGEHNESILRDLLGYGEDRIAQLHAEGAFGGPPEMLRRPQPVPLTDLLRQQRIREVDHDYGQRLDEIEPR